MPNFIDVMNKLNDIERNMKYEKLVMDKLNKTFTNKGMNREEIGEIEDIIGQLGGIEGEHHLLAFECVERLYALIKPYLSEEQTR